MEFTATATDQGADLPRERDAAPGERQLVERARSEKGAFALLYRRYYPEIGRYLQARTGDRHATEDLLAETFLAALKGIGRYRHRGIPFRWWLYRIAANAANRRARRGRRWPASLDHHDEPSAPGEPVERRLERAEEERRVRKLLGRLPSRHQDVLVLRYLQDLELGEIAAVLGCRPGTVKSRLGRAREALRRIAQQEA